MKSHTVQLFVTGSFTERDVLGVIRVVIGVGGPSLENFVLNVGRKVVALRRFLLLSRKARRSAGTSATLLCPLLPNKRSLVTAVLTGLDV